ncbi:phage tail assembly protein [Photobacterium halotolerans]|uniref:Phage tail assembly protein n=1 Tax=Photobacterium halotolerans TaxID=265726 RepID=A0A7X4WDD3_9GAMM|nr:phage tail assembly protein [Photobacterium halotolerans]NAW66711.1 phage tail assembly protein [Photobacterium halotolerans]
MKKSSTLPFFKRNENPTLELKTLSVEAFRALPFMGVDGTLSAKQHFAQRKAAIMGCTDLTAEEFETFTAPDFNQLYSDISAFILKPSDELRDQPLTGKDFEFTLLFPFENELGETIEHIRFKVPKVAHSEALAEISDQHEREDFMFRVVCGLEKADFNQMAINDYLAIKPQVGAFFQQSGDFFRPTTLKASLI